jgi:hypothetical protein
MLRHMEITGETLDVILSALAEQLQSLGDELDGAGSGRATSNWTRTG